MFIQLSLNLQLEMSDVEKPEADDALGTEQTHKREDDLKLRKCEMTKIRHHMEKLCITP